MSQQILLHLSDVDLPSSIMQLIAKAKQREKEVSWFDFVPCDYGIVFTLLSALQRGRFCEWGSGLGVVTGIAELLGYSATGIEMHAPLAELSRELLAEHGLKAQIEIGDYFEHHAEADVYFVYCWPNRVVRTEERFLEIAPVGARLITYYGRNDVRWMQK
ncbi:MAG: hypothetical protein KDB03_11475 [Planctomycetales bacterium]|nr:hypothetical protein [Planctomycetales bacterium]